MDYLTQQFIAAAKKIRDDLRQIAENLATLHHDLEQQTDAVRQADDRKHRGDEPQEIRAEVRFAEDVERNRTAYQDRQHSLQQSATKASWSAFAATALYALIAGVQLFVMKGQLTEIHSATEATQKQLEDFRAVQSAELAIESFSATITRSVPGRDLGATVTYMVRNGGPTVAKEIRVREGSGWIAEGVVSRKGPMPDLKPVIDPDPAGWSLLPERERAFSSPIGLMMEGQMSGSGLSFLATVEVSYRDIFGRAKIANDCLILNFKSGESQPCRELQR